MDIIVHEALMGAVDSDIFKGIENIHLIEKDIVSFKLDDRLHELDTTIPKDTFMLIFCSVNIAQRITRNYKNLARGLIFDPRVLSWSVYSSLIPDEFLLNSRAIALPFGKLYDRRNQLASIFGNKIFIKPDACVKSFSGFSTSLDNLKYEIDSLKQIGNVQPEELVWVDGNKELGDFEYRCWIVEKNILSPVGYSFHKDHKEAPPCPNEILDLARDITDCIELYETILVADFIMYKNEPKLVEMNGFSTSGFYPGINLKEIIEQTKETMLGD